MWKHVAVIRENLCIAALAIGMCAWLVMFLAWALWQEAKIRFFRYTGRPQRAQAIETVADRTFRALCGIPEPGEGWD